MMSQEEHSDGFRDRLYTIDESGKRLWVFAKKPKGKLTTARHVTGIFLLIFFFSAPFLKINGQQLLLFDFLSRKFVIFGVQFWPQDFQLFFIGMIAMIVFILLFTATYGRLWCGWACPQTVFMEVVFRQIEYWIDGDHNRQRELTAAPWSGGKIFKRILKHGIFYLISFIIGNYFLMYIIGSDAWIRLVTDPPSQHVLGLVIMVVFSFVFYFIFAWFREQVCTIVCPYGRLQGVITDSATIMISYDPVRGENRGPIRKNEERSAAGKGDCIDCRQCVLVCPTGIDIRNGTQLECINCACCIDACNDIMVRNGFQPGLIRYASEKMLETRKPWKFSWRSAAYTVVLSVLLAAFTFFILTRNPVEATVMRSPGMLFQDQGEGRISNLYDIKIINKTAGDLPVELKLMNRPGEIRLIGNPPVIKSQTVGQAVFFIILDKAQITGTKMNLEIGVYSNGELLDQTSVSFMGPK